MAGCRGEPPVVLVCTDQEVTSLSQAFVALRELGLGVPPEEDGGSGYMCDYLSGPVA